MIDMLGRIGEFGYVHNIDTGVDLSANYVSSSIHYKSPAGTVTEKVCDVVTAATGDYGWTVTAGFFATEGVWEAQLEVNLGAVAGIRKLKNPILFRIGAAGE